MPSWHTGKEARNKSIKYRIFVESRGHSRTEGARQRMLQHLSKYCGGRRRRQLIVLVVIYFE